MSDCFSSISWVTALTFTGCSGIGLLACGIGTGGVGVIACATPILQGCSIVAGLSEAGGVLACLIKCLHDHF